MKQKLQKMIKKVIGMFPHKLPTGVKEFEVFIDKILTTYDLPHNASYKRAVATMIMHEGPLVTKKSLKHFADSIKKSMANQIAYEIIQRIKEEEQKQKELEEAAKKETPIETVSDTPIQSA